jgi:nucleoside 2-deoxyribosyltransferase
MLKKKKIVYLSGPITGKPNNNESAFFEAEKIIKKLGYKVVNPLRIKLFHRFNEPSWKNYMRADLSKLVRCDYVVLLGSWIRSKGVKLEIEIAIQLDIPSFTIKDFIEKVSSGGLT